ncbi:MAG: exodeoxyribonuclease VII large subunit, partial [Sphingomonadales bacterium]|nr:exodeoxyribonuclease VII large subunit [Sphingomonadales bacterium]
MFATAASQQQDVHSAVASHFDEDADPAGLVAKLMPGDNAAPLTITEISQRLKRVVEDRFGLVRVRGELSGVKRAASGHLYLCLKDEGARLDGVMWKGQVGRLSFRPEDGIEVIASGKLTTYPGRSNYQIVIERMEIAGEGALLALLAKLRERLASEGLFDAARKRPLPFLPRVIGVVTSPTGAVIRDILHRLSDRFPSHVVVWPVAVQGQGAAAGIAAAITGFSALVPGGAVPRPDLVIVARGGGSIEDLWSFNEEAVVRAIAASTIPVISAVGHETDTTLADFAADRRAPTPTAAAEMAVPVRAELLAQLAELGLRKRRAVLRPLELGRERLEARARRLPRPEALLAAP